MLHISGSDWIDVSSSLTMMSPPEIPLPDMYDELLQLVEMHAPPQVDPWLLDGPTLADVEGHLDTITTNLIDPYPGYTADYDEALDQIEWEPDA